jgi:hypothetical protein
MDETIFTAVLSIHGVIWGGSAILLLVLLIRRLKIRKEETFEKRDN